MNKRLLILMMVLLCVGLLAACGGSEQTNGTDAPTDSVVDPTGDTTEPTETPDEPTEGPHTCEFGDWTVVTEATCTEDGLKERTCACGEKETETVPATGHSYATDVTEPTCTEKGYTTYTCACGDSYVGDEVEAVGHSYVGSSCQICGAALPASEGLEFESVNYGMGYTVTGIGSCTDSELVIPATYKGLPVLSIEDCAFMGCTQLTSVVVPDSVIQIWDAAFALCENLSEISLPNTIVRMGEAAFAGTAYENDPSNWEDGVLYVGCYLISGTQYIIEDGEVADWIFLASGKITVKKGTRLIADCAFSENGQITEVIFPDGLLFIGCDSFCECEALTTVTVPESVVEMDGAFMDTAITSISIPEGVTEFGGDCFSGCTSLREISLPVTFTKIGWYALAGCPVTCINYAGTMAQWDQVEIDKTNDLTGCIVHCIDGDITL